MFRILISSPPSGSRLCFEILLCLAVQRGSLSRLLQWINLGLSETDKKQAKEGAAEGNAAGGRTVSRRAVELAARQVAAAATSNLAHSRSAAAAAEGPLAGESSNDGGGGLRAAAARFRLACQVAERDSADSVCLREATLYLLALVSLSNSSGSIPRQDVLVLPFSSSWPRARNTPEAASLRGATTTSTTTTRPILQTAGFPPGESPSPGAPTSAPTQSRRRGARLRRWLQLPRTSSSSRRK